jgi:hypothetical protein
MLTGHVEGNHVGSFSHQLQIRRPRWRRAAGNRFVPADEPDSSPFYVQWRREDGRWVVSEIGDETYSGDAPLPPGAAKLGSGPSELATSPPLICR